MSTNEKDALLVVTTTELGTAHAGETTEKTAAIRGEIERTRGQMSRTVNEIEERLSPAHIKEQVADIKQSVLGNYHEAKDHLKEDITRELREAKDKVQGEIMGAKDKVHEEIQHARTAVRDATVGRVQHMVHDARHMVQHAVHDARDTVTDAGSTILGTIKANPVPAALIGLGLGWLLVSARRPATTRRLYSRDVYDRDSYGRDSYGGYEGEAYGYAYGREPLGGRPLQSAAPGIGQRVQQGASHLVDQAHGVGERVGSAAQEVGGRVAGVAQDVRDRAVGVAHDVGERVNHLAHDAFTGVERATHDARIRSEMMVRGAGRQIRRAEQTFESTLRENPLAVGAAALAIGATVGLLLPHTRQEDAWMGSMKDRLMEKAEGVAGEAIHKVESTVTGQLGEGGKGDTKAEAKPEGELQNGLSNGLVKSGTSKSSTV